MRISGGGVHDSDDRWSQGSSSRSLADLLQRSSGKDDDELAYVIDVAARKGLVSIDSLDEFFRLIPHLGERPVVLDAAIDAVIQVRRRGGEAKQDLVQKLKERHPEHAEAIDVAAALSAVISSSVPGRGGGVRGERSLPMDIGPETPDGAPRYTLREALGRGSQGDVYLAVDRLMSRESAPVYVAVKFLRGYAVRQADQRLAAEEALKARRISHESVARVIDRGVTPDGEAFAVFEYVDGGDLEERVRTHGRVQAGEAGAIVLRVARGMQAIHSAGLLHCDLKPSNVILSRAGEPRITDFGLARWITERGAPGSEGSGAHGAIGFASPEQFEGSQPLTAACDVYALGGLLLYLLTARVPNGETPEEARRNLFTGSSGGPLNPDAIALVSDPVLRAICAKALHRSPRERHVSAESLANDLERWQRNESLSWIVESRGTRMRRWVRRERKVVVAAGVCGLVGLGGVVWGMGRYADARAAKVVAEAAAAREQSERDKNEQVRESLGRGLMSLRKAVGEGLDQEWLAQVTIFENLVGPSFFHGEGSEDSTWKDRIAIALQSARQAKFPDGRPSVASLEWQLVAGYWQMRAGAFEEALVQLRECMDGWKVVAPADAQIIDLSGKLWAACVVLKGGGDPADLDRARGVLRQPDTALTQRANRNIREFLEKARKASPVVTPAWHAPDGKQ